MKGAVQMRAAQGTSCALEPVHAHVCTRVLAFSSWGHLVPDS